MFIIIWNFWVIPLFFYSLTHHKCGLSSRIIYAGLKHGIGFNASSMMSFEFISQIPVLFRAKNLGDRDHKHTVTHTHTHLEYQSKWKKMKNQDFSRKIPHSKHIEIHKRSSFHFTVHQTRSLCLAGKPEIIIVLMKCRIVEKFFQRADTSSGCTTRNSWVCDRRNSNWEKSGSLKRTRFSL